MTEGLIMVRVSQRMLLKTNSFNLKSNLLFIQEITQLPWLPVAEEHVYV